MKPSVFILAGALLWAQDIKIGAAIAPQATWLLGTGVVDVGESRQFTFGFAGGLTGRYHLTPELGLGVGLLFSGEGQRIKAIDQGIFGSRQIYIRSERLTYMKFPLTVHYVAGGRGGSGLSVFGGLQPAFLIGVSTVDEDGVKSSVPVSMSGYRSFALGLVAGAGIERELSNQLSLAAHLRWDFSLTNTAFFFSVRPMTLGLMLGLNYSL
ncbi:MAG: porin family protein [Bacteroidia bacterium]